MEKITEEKLRVFVLAASLLASCLFVVVFGLIIEDKPAEILLGKGSPGFTYPFTIQNLMWLIFFSGLGELFVRFRQALHETQQMQIRLLPEDEESMLRAKDLGPYYKQARDSLAGKNFFLQRLIIRVMLQFQSSRSADQANALLNSSLELFQHEIDLRYNMLRYIIWFIPSLGFIGTVIGIALALNNAGAKFMEGFALEESGSLLFEMTANLGVAFYTTLLALMLSSVIVFMLHIAQSKEEKALNNAGQYCLDNLINRLYEK